MMLNGFCHFGNLGTWGWLGMNLNMVFWLGLLMGLTALAVWAIRRIQTPTSTFSNIMGQPMAKEVLQARYARGEITREQYRQILNDLE